MNREELNVTGDTQKRGHRKPYHSPKLVNLGPIQSLVQGAAPNAGNDNNDVTADGSAS